MCLFSLSLTLHPFLPINIFVFVLIQNDNWTLHTRLIPQMNCADFVFHAAREGFFIGEGMSQIKKDTAAEHQSFLSENISVIFILSSFSPSLCLLPLSLSLTVSQALLDFTTKAENLHLIYLHIFSLHICRG